MSEEPRLLVDDLLSAEDLSSAPFVDGPILDDDNDVIFSCVEEGVTAGESGNAAPTGSFSHIFKQLNLHGHGFLNYHQLLAGEVETDRC